MAQVRDASMRWRLWLVHLALILLVLVSIFPFWMVVTASLRPGNLASNELFLRQISFEHWLSVLGIAYQDAQGQWVQPQFPVLLWWWNSVKIAFLSSALVLLLSTTAAYAFARLRFAGKRSLLMGLLFVQMFPGVLALVAVYTIFDHIGQVFPWLGLDSHWSLMLAYSSGVAHNIWVIKGYFETLPIEIEEAAKVEGASTWVIFRRIVLPMTLPILMVVFVLTFVGTIIEYPAAKTILHQEHNLTLGVGFKLFLIEQRYLWGDFAATAILASLPISIVFLSMQGFLIKGLTSGGVKG